MKKMSKEDFQSKISIDNFIDSIWLEQGLSKATLDAYRSDLSGLEYWTTKKNITLENILIILLIQFGWNKDCQKQHWMLIVPI